MCFLCDLKQSLSPATGNHPQAQDAPSAKAREPFWSARRAFVRAGVAAVGAAALPAAAQVDVGKSSSLRKLVPARELEDAARQQYAQLMAQAAAQQTLLPAEHPQVRRLRGMAQRLAAHATPWNARAAQWTWEVNVINSGQINAFCMPAGKIAFYTGILDKLNLNDDEAAMIMGHEMAHALREHARAQMAKSTVTQLGLRLGGQLLGWGDWGDVAAKLGAQLLNLKFSRADESEADLVGLEMAARAAYEPQASVSLWQKMSATSDAAMPDFLSTHPSSPDRVRDLQANVSKVRGLYEAARRG